MRHVLTYELLTWNAAEKSMSRASHVEMTVLAVAILLVPGFARTFATDSVCPYFYVLLATSKFVRPSVRLYRRRSSDRTKAFHTNSKLFACLVDTGTRRGADLFKETNCRV